MEEGTLSYIHFEMGVNNKQFEVNELNYLSHGNCCSGKVLEKIASANCE